MDFLHKDIFGVRLHLDALNDPRVEIEESGKSEKKANPLFQRICLFVSITLYFATFQP